MGEFEDMLKNLVSDRIHKAKAEVATKVLDAVYDSKNYTFTKDEISAIVMSIVREDRDE